MENKIIVRGTQEFMGIEIPVIEGGFGEGCKVILAKTVAEIHGVRMNDVQKIIENGYAYETKDTIYFDTSKLDKYGVLSNIKIDEQKAGARVEFDDEKRNVTDFALWIKILISATTNFVGVYIGIWILDKLKKDKLWEIKGIIDREPTEEDYKCLNILTTNKILFTIQKTLMNKTFIYIYSSNKDESRLIKDVLNKMGAKHIVNEETVKL